MLGMRYGSDGEVIKKDFREYIVELEKKNQELRSEVGSDIMNTSMANNSRGGSATGGAMGWLKGIGDRLANLGKK
jgi:hypothetical protein